MTTKPRKREGHGRGKPHLLSEIGQRLTAALQQLADTRAIVAEVAEDNMALLESAKRCADAQEGIRTAVVREADRLREQIFGELQFEILRNACKEFIPILHATKRILADADFANAEEMQRHIESLALALDGVLMRLGIERLEVREGIDLFNVNCHECIKTCGDEDSPLPHAPHRAIVRVEEPGYAIKGRLVMPARVWVQKRAQEGENTNSQEKGLLS